MAGYSPLKITGMTSGLIQERENFLLPDDAYPVLQNAYIWREKIKRKKGFQLLGRLQRNLTLQSLGNTIATGVQFNLFSQISRSGSISGITQANPGEVTTSANHLLQTGQFVTISGVVGMTQVNGKTYEITVTGANTFTIGVDTTSYTAYVSGGSWKVNDLSAQSLKTIVPGSVVITMPGGHIFTDQGNGTFLLSVAISGATQANPCVIQASTSDLVNGNQVIISGVVGMTQLNGNTYTITVIDPTHFSLNGIDSTGFSAYISGGTFSIVPSVSVGTINYVTGNITLTTTAGAGTSTVSFSYYPNLPVMGIRTRELQNSAQDQTIFFDQVYAYIFNGTAGQFQEFIPGTTWNAAGVAVSGVDFFWSTNYWISSNPPFTTTGTKLFWETNGSGGESGGGDPPRITDGTTWVDFTSSTWNQIDATTSLFNWLCNLPYRGRMVVFNTYEGLTAAGPGSAQNFSNRIRWSTIGNPFIPFTSGPPAKGSWRDDIRGQGGFLDIPTSEDIISIGFVRDNLVIYCERSTWQLRYTGRSIAPFQIEKVNSELGVESTFAAVQFDTSLVGVGDKGIIECDSYKAQRIDIKIPDFVFQFNIINNGVARVQGIRDFPNRLAYWTIPLVQFYPNVGNTNWIFPTARLLYNYENDSWAIFNDSLTTLGNFQLQTSPNWLQTPQTWIEYQKTWLDDDAGDPIIVGGNQQGFIEKLDQLTVNDPSLFISNIINNGSGIAQITSPNHNMQSGFVIGIKGIVASTPFSGLNNGIYSIVVIDQNNFTLRSFNATSNEFDIEVVGSPAGTYVGSGLINIRENFSVVSKKFNFLDEGQNIQMGYLDLLMPAVQDGEISLFVYLNYDDVNPSNTLYSNQIVGVTPETPDTFFNTVIPTEPSQFAVAKDGTKFWQRIYCATRANFLTLQYAFSNAQMASTPQQKEVEIDAQILWIRKGGRLWQG